MLLTFIKKLLFQNIGFKISAIVIALLSWYIIQGEEVLELNQKLQVKIVTPKGVRADRGEFVFKDVLIKGPRVLLTDVPTKKSLQTTITIPEGKTGRLVYRLDRESVPSLDRHLDVTIHDPYVVLNVDYEMTRKVPIKEVLVGTPQEGFRILNALIEPKFIKITGLRSQVSDLKRIQTELIDISGIAENKTYEVLIAPDLREKFTLSQEKATVKLEVGEDKVNKTFEEIPIEIESSEFLTNVKPRTATITIQGDTSALNFVEKGDLKAFVDLRGQKPGRIEKELQVKIPQKAVLIDIQPKRVFIDIFNIKRSRERQ